MSLTSIFSEYEKIKNSRRKEKREWFKLPLFERVSNIEQNWRNRGELLIREEMERRILVRYPVKIAQ